MGNPATTSGSEKATEAKPTGQEKKRDSRGRITARKARRVWQPAWLEAYREYGTAVAACRVVGISRSAAYEARVRDEEFAIAWDEAERETTKLLEDTLFERALKGDTVAAIFMLKARRPNVYRERVDVQHSGQVEHVSEAVNEQINGLVGEVDRLAKRLAALAPERASAAAGQADGD